MKKLIWGTLLSLISTHALATDHDVDGAIKATEKECKKLIRMNSLSGADYTPGVDVRGNKVVSADLNGGNKIDLPKEIVFDLGIDLADKYKLGDGFYGKANLGEIKVKGRNVYWNGKKLDQEDNNAVLDACLEQYGSKP